METHKDLATNQILKARSELLWENIEAQLNSMIGVSKATHKWAQVNILF